VPEARSSKANGVGWAAKEVAERARSIVRLEVELALLEIKRKLVRIAVGIGLGAGAAVVALFAIGFLAAGGAAALALALPVWASLLIVGGALLGAAIALVLLARKSLREGTPPLPEEAIEEARKTTETLRADGN
jgi:multisubunit Na+/H+ antiporter MnhC subunit